jgi:hypothetical protein
MGLFSSSTKVYVASTAYNMAGEQDTRINFLKTTVARSVLTNVPSIAESLVSAQLYGPIMTQRGYFRWTNNHYPEGQISGSTTNRQLLTETHRDTIKSFIPPPAEGEIYVTLAFIDNAEISFFAERYFLENKYELYGTDWYSDYNDAAGQMKIIYEDLSEELITVPDFEHRSDYMYVYYRTGVDPDLIDHMFIYEMGSGNVALDAIQETATAISEFYPFIPLRYNNKAISHQDYVDNYESHAESYNRATGGEIVDILASIEDNPSIDDVDHAFLTFGVELNTGEKAGRRYIYEFMKNLRQYQNDINAGDTAWEANNEYFAYRVDYLAWANDQSDTGSPRYGDPEPTAVVFPVPRISKLDLKSTHSATVIKYDVSIEWVFIKENFGVGKGKVGAAVNELWWEDKETIFASPGSFTNEFVEEFNITDLAVTHSRLYRQVSEDVYSYLDLFGMSHINRIYKGKSVQITTKAALADVDESGFVVPMHYPTIQNVPLVLANELANSNKIIVFNSYQVVTTRWYQKGFFRILIMIIVMVVVALVFPPAAPGLLGANASVGVSLGFAAGSTAAIIAGATANAIAAIVLTQAISTVSVELFGEKWGKLIAAIVTVMVGNMAGNYHQTGSFSVNWGEFMRVDNLIGMTDSVASGVKGYAASEISDIEQDMAEAKEEYEDDVQSILERMEELGYSGVDLDPLMFVQEGNSDNRSVTSEPIEIFLRRTLLTGSDIAEMTHAMIDDFVEISLKLPEANG